MFKLDVENQQLKALTGISLEGAGYKERADLQKFILNSSSDFFSELGLEVFVVGEEICPSQTFQDRIDLLAFDPEGKAIIVELKRGNNRWHLAQALSYAGMIADWGFDRIRDQVSPDRRQEFDEFLQVEADEVNRSQKIILIAEDYDFEVLVAAKWLCESFGVDIVCCQIALSADSQGVQYLSCVQIYPPKAIEDLAIQRGRARAAAVSERKTLEAKLARCENPAVKDFFEAAGLGARMNIRKDSLAYPQTGTIRWYVEPRASRASVYQAGRFDNDVEFWRTMLAEKDSIKLLQRGLRFSLRTPPDFDNFKNATNAASSTYQWAKPGTAGESTDFVPGPL
jgi:hypothetical protein